jgi:hypothetical protein
MAKITIESDYLKANLNIKKGDIVQIVDEGRQKPMKGFDGKEKMVWEFSVKLPNGETKIYTMNVSTQKVLIEQWGDDTKNWMNKPLEASIERKPINGQIKNILYLLPAEGIVTKDIPIIEEGEEPMPDDFAQ